MESTDDLPGSQDDVDRYSLTPTFDGIKANRALDPEHGGSPDADSDVTSLETGIDSPLWPWSVHSEVLTEKDSLGYDQLTDLISGRTGNLDVDD